jgi:hypothetical protein
VIHSGHAQQASPLIIALGGLVFMVIGAFRLYGRIAPERRRSVASEGAARAASVVRMLGSSGVLGVGFLAFGLLIVCIGLAKI